MAATAERAGVERRTADPGRAAAQRYADVHLGAEPACEHLVRFLEGRGIEAVQLVDSPVVRIALDADHFGVPVANLALVVALEAWVEGIGDRRVEVVVDDRPWTIHAPLEDEAVQQGETAILPRPAFA